MKELIRHKLQHDFKRIKTSAKWVLFSIVSGLLVGGVGTLFYFGMYVVTLTRTKNPWLIFLLPVSGILIVGCYRLLHDEKDTGTNLVLSAIHSDENLPLRMAPLIFISTLITHLFGGSAGREGAALQLGGSIGNGLGKLFRFDEKDKHIMIMCGMSAVFSALFGTPVAAAIFSLEVVSIGVLYYAALVPCVFSSFLAVGIARAAGLEGEHFPVEMIPVLDLKAVGLLVLLGILCAAVSILFCVLLHTAEHAYRKYFPDARVRILAGSFLFIALTLLSGTRDYCGSSMGLIESSIEGSARYEAFLMKMLFTAVALGAGFKGGEIVPTLCVGAALGCAFGEITGFAPSLCAACGMAALFAGVTNCPITSLVIALELFGYEGMEYFSIIIAVAFALSGYYGLYASQKFVYSKTRTEFINRRSNG